MALVGTITKQPREILDCDISYIPVLTSGATISGVPTSEVTPSGLTVGTVSVVDGNKINFKVSSGTDGISYKVTVLVNTSNGLLYEDEVTVVVGEE